MNSSPTPIRILIWCFFLFVGEFAQGQTIDNVRVSQNYSCNSSSLKLDFDVHSIWWLGIHFDENTNYYIELLSSQDETVFETTVRSEQSTGFWNPDVTISETIKIPKGVETGEYKIIVQSTNPRTSPVQSDSFKIVSSIITPPTASNSSIICIGGTLNLYASDIPGASYLWAGPNDFTSSQQNPIITNTTAAMAGEYTVVATVNGCQSIPANTTVIINAIHNNTINYGNTGIICDTANENGTIAMTAPPGTVFTSVEFASYGTPNGTSGNFTLGTCHATTSQEIVEKYLLSKNSASIPATNEIFGDPCVGTVKRLFVQATYGEPQEPICNGTNPGIINGTVPTGSANFTYRWKSSTTGPKSGFSIAPGVSNLQDYDPGNLTQTTWFKRTVINSCKTESSNVVKIEVYPVISNNNITLANGSATVQAICPGSDPGTITGTIATGANENLTYLWESSITGPDTGFAPAAGISNLKDYTPDSLSQTTWFRRIVSSALCESDISNVAEIKINPLPSITLSGTNTICIGETTTLTGTLTGTGPWTIDGSINGVAFSISIPNANFSQEVTPTETTEYKITRIEDATGCINTEDHSVTVTVIKENIWTGAQSDNWNNQENWMCHKVPTLETDVLIPSGLSVYPSIYNTETGLAKNLTIESGASIKVGTGKFGLAGDIVNNGMFSIEDGTMVFAGTSPQSIPSGFFKNNILENLLIWNPSSVTSGTIIKVKGILQVFKGTFITGNNLTLLSTVEKTALIDGSGTGEIVGTITMQRYLSSSFGYKYFSSPFQNSTVGDFSAYVNLSASFPNFYNYNENRQDVTGNDVSGWEKYTTTSSGLRTMEGYALNFGSTSTPVTVEISGKVNNGTYSRTLYNHNRTYTQGFNLIGNPYPSPIDWNASSGWTKNNIDDAIYFFTAGNTDQYTGTYTSYVNGISSRDGKASNIIPSMQGFFVHVSDSPTGKYPVEGTLGMTNEIRTINFQQEFLKHTKSRQTGPPLIRISAGFENEQQDDPLVIYFDSYSSPDFEKDLDAHKLMNTAINVPNFYSITSKNQKLAINAIPDPNFNAKGRIPLGLKTEKAGSMYIKLEDLQNISSGAYIYLIDEEKRIAQDLNQDPVYQFQAKKGAQDSRFFIMFSQNRLTDPAIAFNELFSVTTGNKQISVHLNLQPGINGVLRVSTVSGQILQVLKVNGEETVEINGIRSAGIYFINLLSEGENFSKKVLVK